MSNLSPRNSRAAAANPYASSTVVTGEVVNRERRMAKAAADSSAAPGRRARWLSTATTVSVLVAGASAAVTGIVALEQYEQQQNAAVGGSGSSGCGCGASSAAPIIGGCAAGSSSTAAASNKQLVGPAGVHRWAQLGKEQTVAERFAIEDALEAGGAGAPTAAEAAAALRIPKGRMGHAACAVGGKMYVHGGLHTVPEGVERKVLPKKKEEDSSEKKKGDHAHTHTHADGSTCSHDHSKDAVPAREEEPAAPTCNAAAVAAETGQSPAEPKKRPATAILDDLWAYDRATQQWEPVEFDRSLPFPSGRLHHSLVPLRDGRHFVLVAGFNNVTTPEGHSSHNDVWKFDTVERTWTRLEFNKTETKRKYDAKRAVEAALQKEERAVFNAAKEIRMAARRAAKRAEIIDGKRKAYADKKAARDARNARRAVLRAERATAIAEKEAAEAEKAKQQQGDSAANDDADECAEGDPDCEEVEEVEAKKPATSSTSTIPAEVGADEPDEAPLPEDDEALLTEFDQKVIARVPDSVAPYRAPRGRTLFPAGRGSQEVVLSPDGESLLMFGGHSKIYAEPTAELWRFRFADNSWEELTPRNETFPNAPSRRVGFSFTSIPSSATSSSPSSGGDIYLFGGACAAGSPTEVSGQCSDVWRLDVTAAKDGDDSSATATWAYVPTVSDRSAALAASPFSPAFVPQARRAGHSQAVLDGIVFMFGGVFLDNEEATRNHLFSDLWAFALPSSSNASTAAREWQPVTPNYGRGPAPRPTFGHTIVAIGCDELAASANKNGAAVPAHCGAGGVGGGGSVLVFGGRHDSVTHYGSNELWEYTVGPQ